MSFDAHARSRGIKPRCELCRYWFPAGKNEFDDLILCGRGECRLHAPGIHKDEEGDTYTGFPETHRDVWCGEYVSRVP